MSRMRNLINEHCPTGVPFRALGDVGVIVRGKRFVKADMIGQGVPCIHYGEIYTKYGVSTTVSHSFVSAARAETLRFANPGDVVLAAAGETIADIGKSVAWLGDKPIAIHDACYAFSSPLDPKYVSYYFSSHEFRGQIRKSISSSKISSISTSNLAKAMVPCPPLEVQREIVKILDRFSEYETELESAIQVELRARGLQYAHYSDTLLNFGIETPRHALGNLGLIFGGLTGKSKADFSGGTASYVTYKNVYKSIAVDVAATDRVHIGANERQRSLAWGDVLFTASSESAADVGLTSVVTTHPTEPIYLNSFCIGFRPHDVEALHPEFAKHLFRSHGMRAQIIRTANGVTRYNVSKVRLAKVAVPVPSRADQLRIASILDRFDSLSSDLDVQLRIEYAARRDQYESYRDKLLAFNEDAST